MFLQYSVEDLLKLRASPLICRPDGLPPEEQWMGTQDQTAKRPTTRGRQEDGSFASEGVHKRTNFESSQRKLATDPERIVLGPPRRSFASSNGKPFGKYGAQDSEDGLREKHQERTRTGEEGEHKLGDRRGLGGPNSRHGNRFEHDGTTADRPRRRHEDEEGDGRNHRDYDRPKWMSKESRDEMTFGDDAMDGGNIRSGFKRDQGRSKFDQPWFRNEKGGEEGRRDREHGSGWRNNRSKDGDWDLPTKGDVDPEWMDSVDNVEPFQAHTQEDFQKWKERMKAGDSAGGPRSDQIEEPSVLTVSDETFSAFAAPGPSVISPDPGGNSMDKFFARFNEKKVITEEQHAAKPAAKTRFASLFSPLSEVKVETPPLPPPPPPPTVQPTTIIAEVSGIASPQAVASQPGIHKDADQAGFQRILQMLGKKESSPAPSIDGQKPKAPNLPGVPSHQRHASPDLVALFKQDQPIRKTPLSNAPSAPPGFERLLDSRSPVETQKRHSNTPNKDDLLLNLLRQAEISSKPQPQQSYMENRGPLNMFGAPDQRRNEEGSGQEHERPQMQERAGGRSLFDDPAISSMSYGGDMRPRDGLQRIPTNGPPPGFEDPYLDQRGTNGPQTKAMHSMPPGLQRTLGLEQLPRIPPGWNPQHGSQGISGPPPMQNRGGMPPGLGSRNMQPFGNPQQPPPMPQQVPGQGPTRPPQQRKYTGELNAPAYQPGMAPPPGFMSHGPPPGFQHTNAAQAAQNYGRYAMGGNDRAAQHPGPPPPMMDRAYMDMYAGERGGMRSGTGVPMPPGFR